MIEGSTRRAGGAARTPCIRVSCISCGRPVDVRARRLLLLGLILFLLAPFAQGQVPQQQQNQNDPNRNSLSPRIRNGVVPVPLEINERQAVNLVRQRFSGNVLRISLVGEAANRRYQIRLENEGKVFTVFVHATTGVISGGI